MRLAAELLLFAAAIAALAHAGEAALAVAFALTLTLSQVLLHAWRQREVA